MRQRRLRQDAAGHAVPRQRGARPRRARRVRRLRGDRRRSSRANVASLGWDLAALRARQQLAIDYVQVEPAQIEEAGAYDLEGLFIRLGAAIDAIGAKRVVIDSLEVLFGALHDQATLRSELRRLFRWLKERGVTAIITAERGDGTLTRHGLEEYVSDCVILLDHRVDEQVSTRRLRIVKYRGSSHSADETPFMIDDNGFRVMPIGSLRLEHDASERAGVHRRRRGSTRCWAAKATSAAAAC